MKYDCTDLKATSKVDSTVISESGIAALSLAQAWNDADACLKTYVPPQHRWNGVANANGLYNANSVFATAGVPIVAKSID